MKTYYVEIKDAAWLLVNAPESKSEWVKAWILKNVPEPEDMILWREATEDEIEEYTEKGFHTWKLTESITEYSCGHCGKPIEHAIEGELVCPKCWTYLQMSKTERQFEKDIAEYERQCEEDSRCPDCGTVSEEIGFRWEIEDVLMLCPNCGYWQLWSRKAGIE